MQRSAIVFLAGVLAAGGASAQLGGGSPPANGDQGLGMTGRAEADRVPVVLTRVTGGVGLTDTLTDGHGVTGGVAWVDYNGDHLPDLFLTNGAGRDHFLYRNDGDGTFTDMSHLCPKPKLADEEGGVAFADVDNDGDEDILVYVDAATFDPFGVNAPEGGPNRLYANLDGTQFVEVGAAAGVVDPRGWRNNTAGFADYDLDGLVDLHLGHWQWNNDPAEGVTDTDRMLRNVGGGVFQDVTATTRLDGHGRDTAATIWFDVDRDGRPDLYVANTGTSTGFLSDMDAGDVLYVNDATVPWFRDGTGDPRVVGDDAYGARGLDVGDIDNDGDWDLYITDLFSEGPEPNGNVLYLGETDGSLSDNVAPGRGVAAADSSACNFADFDNDGHVDLWVGTTDPATPEFLYVNRGDGGFRQQHVPGFTGNATLGGSVADFDGDGDMDICLWTDGGPSCIYRNDTVSNRHWVELKLFGTTANRSAIGAVVTLTEPDGEQQLRRVSGGDSAHSQQDLVVHFGVDQHQVVDVTIAWPGGGQETYEGLAVDRLHFIEEGTGVLPEILEDDIATWDESSQVLVLSTVTSYGGRAVHEAVGFGPMPYFVNGLGFRGVFAGVPANPGQVTVVSDTGATFVLDVETIP